MKTQLDQRLGQLDAQWERRFGDLSTEVHQRLDGVEQRLSGLEQRLTGVEERLTGVPGCRVETDMRRADWRAGAVSWLRMAPPHGGAHVGNVFFSRHRRKDRFLHLRLALLLVGGGLGLVGMRLDNGTLVSVATGIVLVGFLLRFAPQRQSPSGAIDRKPPVP